jgi:purine nucleosidase
MNPERIILDVDSAGDDILAVLFAAACPELRLEAVTTCTGAAGPIEQVTNVVLNTLALAGRGDIPVAAGAWRPIVGHPRALMDAPVHFEKQLAARFGDRLARFNPPAPRPTLAAHDRHAVDVIIDTVMANPGEITVVTTGPLTNLGMALLQQPALAGALRRLIVLGGCFVTPGNMTPLAEYNLWADPEASRIVLNADTDKILVPLDVCEDNRAATGMLTRDDLFDMATEANPVAAMIADVFPIYIDIWPCSSTWWWNPGWRGDRRWPIAAARFCPVPAVRSAPASAPTSTAAASCACFRPPSPVTRGRARRARDPHPVRLRPGP